MNLSLTAQERLAGVSVDVSDMPPSKVWKTIATDEHFQQELVDAVRELLAGTTRNEWSRTLFEAGVTAQHGLYADIIQSLDRNPDSTSHQEALEYTAAIGQGENQNYGLPLTLDAALDTELERGPLALLSATDRTPFINAHIDKQKFRGRRREQREHTLKLLSVLATECDVTITCTGLSARWLAANHRDDLPIDFGEAISTSRKNNGPGGASVEDLAAEYEQSSGPVRLLRLLADEPTQTLPQSALDTELRRDKSTISTYISRLEESHLVEKYSTGSGNKVTLINTGTAVLERLDAEREKQATFDDLFADTGNSSQRPCTPALGIEGDDPPDDTASGSTPYRTRYMPGHEHTATAEAATENGITTADVQNLPADRSDERHVRRVSYNATRDEAIIGFRATTPFQYIVSSALSLASPRLFDAALPPDRLEEMDIPAHVLRQERCIGGLSAEAAADPSVLRDNIIEWGQRLSDLTRKMQNDSTCDREQLRGEIMSSAHGLAGTIAHLLDAAGVELIRELRLPSGLTSADYREIARAVSTAVSIQSRYNDYAIYRQLYESRTHLRDAVPTASVDAQDPLGEYIGSLVIRGPTASQFGSIVSQQLQSTRELHDDAPEIAVPVPIRELDRSDYAATVTRILLGKNLRPTREAITLCRAFAPDPWAVSQAVFRLGSESQERDIRLDEVRVALSHLDTTQLLPDANTTASRVVMTLLRSSTGLTKTELAEAADVSPRSLRPSAGNLEALVALDLVREDAGRYRFVLPFNADDDPVCPMPVSEPHTRPRDIIYELVLSAVEQGATATGNPDHPLGQPFFGPEFTLSPLLDYLPWIEPWVRLAIDLCNARSGRKTVAIIGDRTDQTALQRTSAVG